MDASILVDGVCAWVRKLVSHGARPSRRDVYIRSGGPNGRRGAREYKSSFHRGFSARIRERIYAIYRCILVASRLEVAFVRNEACD